MDKDENPCCAAEALTRIRQVKVDGIPVGFRMLDSIFEEVAALHLSSEEQIRRELLKRVKIYNYVPRPAEESYAAALVHEYQKTMN